jgi:hypothetical protein
MSNPTHCWTGYRETLEWGSDEWAKAMNEMSKTCMLPANHSGPHVWTNDDEITFTFAPSRKESK